MREKLLLDFGWRFERGHLADMSRDFEFGTSHTFAKAGDCKGALQPDFDDKDWQQIDLPHDWAVDLPIDASADWAHGYRAIGRRFPENSVGWYRRTFEIPAEDTGRRLALEFDGVFRDCQVWLNGCLLGRHESGYSSFRFDITDYVIYGGKNSLVVRVDASHFEGWFYEGAGIYRHVWLAKTHPVHVAHWGTFVTSDVKTSHADVTARTTLTNESDHDAALELIETLEDASGKTVTTANPVKISLKPWEERELSTVFNVKNPLLWSVESPTLYRLVTTLRQNGVAVDRYETSFGIRTIRFDANEGFFLNGKHVYLKGTCNHQDHAGVGSALPDRLQYYRIEKLKEMGCNAYRTSHNPPTPELLEACDRLGMLVMDEHRMVGSSPEFMGQLERLIRRDRNHPSVIMWSLGNEEMKIQCTELGIRLLQSMKRLAKKLDPTRLVTAAMNGGWGKGFSTVVDVQGCNYIICGNYDEFHKNNPTLPVVGSEEASTFSTRGVYETDKTKGVVSAFGNDLPSWGSTADRWWQFYQERPFIAGAFVWTGFDYRGEPLPQKWPTLNSQYAFMDSCGFPKDNYYYYQAWWTDKPVLHILPHWNWPGREGQDILVRCFSNCEEVELSLNGTSLGRQPMKKNSLLDWTVKYAPGTLTARGFTNGKEISKTDVATTDDPAAIRLTPDRPTIRADGEDVCCVTVAITDRNGRVVPVANNEVRFSIAGGGKIIGVGNGDPTTHESDKASKRKAFNGLCMVIIQTTKQAGPIRLTASATGLSEAVITLQAESCSARPSVP